MERKDEIDIKELPEPYDTIAEALGADAAIVMAKTFGGEQIYFPKLETIEKPLRYRKMLGDFNGYNYKYLARKYNLSVRHVKRLMGEFAEEKQNEPIPGQMSLFE